MNAFIGCLLALRVHRALFTAENQLACCCGAKDPKRLFKALPKHVNLSFAVMLIFLFASGALVELLGSSNLEIFNENPPEALNSDRQELVDKL